MGSIPDRGTDSTRIRPRKGKTMKVFNQVDFHTALSINRPRPVCERCYRRQDPEGAEYAGIDWDAPIDPENLDPRDCNHMYWECWVCGNEIEPVEAVEAGAPVVHVERKGVCCAF